MISYVECIQEGFSHKEAEKIHHFEYFIYNTYLNGFISNSIPGLRVRDGTETQYAMRYSSEKYHAMINRFIDYVPTGYQAQDFENCNMPGFRMTLADGSRFYPVNYHGDLVAWRRLMKESAEFHGTLTARFKEGKFVLSDGRKISLLDIEMDSLQSTGSYPPDW